MIVWLTRTSPLSATNYFVSSPSQRKKLRISCNVFPVLCDASNHDPVVMEALKLTLSPLPLCWRAGIMKRFEKIFADELLHFVNPVAGKSRRANHERGKWFTITVSSFLGKRRWNVTLHLMLTGKLKKTSFLKMAKSTERLMVSGNESNKEFKRNIASLRIKYLVSCRFGMMIACYYANCLKSFAQTHIWANVKVESIHAPSFNRFQVITSLNRKMRQATYHLSKDTITKNAMQLVPAEKCQPVYAIL